jgi:hypothetical protein
MSQTPFYSGVITLGGLAIPCYPNSQFADPFNDQNPAIIGNYFESSNYAPGLRVPVITVSIAPRDHASEVFGTTFLGWLFSRTAIPEHDTSVIGSGIKFWNGRKGWDISGVKLDSLQIQFSRGSLGVNARFVGTGKTALGAAPSFTPWDDTILLSGINVTIRPEGSVSPDCAVGGSLTMSNNHRPSPCMNGSRYPAAMNASQFTAGLQLTRRTSADDLVSGDYVDIVIDGANIDRTFRVVNPIWQTGDDLGIQVPENMQAWQCLVTGGAANGAPVLINPFS